MTSGKSERHGACHQIHLLADDDDGDEDVDDDGDDDGDIGEAVMNSEKIGGCDGNDDDDDGDGDDGGDL